MLPAPGTLEPALERWLHAAQPGGFATCGAFLSGRHPKFAQGFGENPPCCRTHKRVNFLRARTGGFAAH